MGTAAGAMHMKAVVAQHTRCWHSFYHGCSASAEANDSLSVHQKVDLMSFDEIAYVPTFAVTAYLYVFA